MTITKLTNNIQPLDEVDKINEIIDELDNANVAIDSKSITKNTSDELQTVGVIDSNNTTNAIKTWIGTKAQYEAITTKDSNMLYFCTDSGEIYLGSVLISNKTDGKDVGDVVFSLTPKTDAGLHLLDGALIQGGGIYSAFVDYIAGLVSTYSDLFVTENDWQTAVTTYGVCGKFVYTAPVIYYAWIAGNSIYYTTTTEVGLLDVYQLINGVMTKQIDKSGRVTVANEIISIDVSGRGDYYNYYRSSTNDYTANQATVRLPKITGIIEGTTNLSALGDLVEAGLPNITGSFYMGKSGNTQNGYGISGAFESVTAAGQGNSAAVNGNTYQFNFDASRSSSIYGNSTTVQPQTIKVLYYIVISTAIKSPVQVDVDEIATDINGKADTDLSNVPSSKGILTESYVNGTSWYRVYSDGWCEQGGQITGLISSTVTSIAFLQNFVNTNYYLNVSDGIVGTSWGGAEANSYISSHSTSGFDFKSAYGRTCDFRWRACGYIR